MMLRKATAGDYPEVMRLYSSFIGEITGDFQRYAKPHSESYLSFIKEKNAHIYVATLGGELVGFISFSLRKVVRYPKPIAEVEELFVAKGHRKQGVGRMLMEQVHLFARKNSCQYVFVASANQLTGSHNFYNKLGYDLYARHYRKKA